MTADPETVMLSSRDDFVAYLEGDGVPYRVDENDGRVLIPIDKDGLRSTMAIIWPPEQSLVQMILGFPYPVQPLAVPQVFEAIGRLNHVLAMPGFGFDADAGFTYYRLVQPRRRDGTLSAGDMQRLFATTTRTAAQFHRALAAVIDGRAKGAQILEIAKPPGS